MGVYFSGLAPLIPNAKKPKTVGLRKNLQYFKEYFDYISLS